jgi:type IV fimbrial biogenesis protein FimT
MRPTQQASAETLLGEGGYTVARLLVTTAIAGMMLAVAAPNFSQTLRVYSLRGAAREVFAELQSARMAAVMENNRYGFVLSDDHDYTIFHDDNNNAAPDAGETVSSKDIQASNPLATIATSGPIVFASNGTAPSFGTITLTNTFGDTMQLDISAAGRVRIR